MNFSRILLFACLLSAVNLRAQIRVNFNIDTKSERKAISPLIYGTNDRYTHAKAKRLGGNRLSNFNWENNASNGGIDYINSNDGYIPWQQDVLDNQYGIPGITLTNFHDRSLSQGAYSLVTLPLMPYVAGDFNGTVTPSQAPPSSRWKKVIHRKPGALSLSPDMNDNFVYNDEEVNFLINKYGNSGTSTGIKGYALDNEPGIWFHSHPILWGQEHTRVKYLMDNSFELAERVKELDAGAEIFGPASWGVAEFENLQFAPDWDEMNQGQYPNFVDYYLAKMKQRSESRPDKKRLLDVLDLHWYPQATNDGVSPFDNGTDYATNKARMEMTRSLWDHTYIENTWIGQDPGKRAQFLPFLPKMNEQINTYYPGTKFAISEYSYMGITHPSGGIAQADALGIFGKQNLYLATYWGGVDGYIKSGFDIYQNYDGKGGQFGDISVLSTTNDLNNSAVHASIESADQTKLHLVAMNKSQDESILATIKITGDKQYKSARVWAFDSQGMVVRQLKNIRVINNNQFEYEIPKLTVCHILPTDEDLSIFPDFEAAFITPNAGYSDGTASFELTAKLTDGDNNITNVTADLSAVGGSDKAPLTLLNAAEHRYFLNFAVPSGTSSGVKNIKLTATDATARSTETTVSYRIIKKTTSTVIWDGDVIGKGVGEIFYDPNDPVASSTAKIEKRASGGNVGPANLFMHFSHEPSRYNLMTFRMSNNGNPSDARDISDYGYLEFYIRSNAPADADIEFNLRDASPQLNVSASVFLKAGGYISSFNPNGYTKVKIPVAELTAGSEVKLEQIWQLNFLSNTAAKGFDVWIDDVRALPYSHPYKEPVISNLALSKVIGYPDDMTEITLSASVSDPDNDLREVSIDLSEIGGASKQILMGNAGQYSAKFKVAGNTVHGKKKIRVNANDMTENSVDKTIEFTVREIGNSIVIWDGDVKNTGRNIETNVNTKATVRQTGGNKAPIVMNMHLDQMTDGFAAATWDWNEGTENTEIKDFSDKRYLCFSLKLTPPTPNYDMEIYLKDFDINSTPSLFLKANGYVASYTGNYQLVKIPLNDLFTNPDLKTNKMTRFGFLTNRLGENTKLDFQVDDIYVTGSMVADVSINVIDARCGATGKIDVKSVAGQSGVLQYFLNGEANPNGINSPVFENLAPGKYILRIAGNDDFAYMEEVTVGGSSSTLQLTAQASVGSVDVTVTGGSGRYSYLWNSGQTTEDLTGLSTGKYSVVVTDLASGCKATLDIDVTGAQIAAQITDATCQPNGKIKVTGVTGTSEPLSYYINDMLNPAGAGNPEFINLAPGSYTIKVKTVSGFEQEVEITVGGSGSAPQLSFTSADGTIDLTVAGGSGNYSYLWSNGSTTEDLDGLNAGDYTVQVTDLSTNCKTSITATVNRSVEPNFQVVDALCSPNGAIAISGLPAGLTNIRFTINEIVNPAGVDNPRFSGLLPGSYTIRIAADNNYTLEKIINLGGTLAPTLSFQSRDRNIDLSVIGGSGNFTYSWSNGAKTEDLTNLDAGDYTVTVSDLTTGCKSTQTITVSPWELVLKIGNARCEPNGTIEVVSVTGGNGSYQYYLNGVLNSSGNQFSGLASGVYTVKVEDDQGFTLSKQVNIGGASIPLNLSGVIDGRSINLTVTGGSGNYTFMWSNGSSSEDLINASSGSHSVSVIDALTGCRANASFTISTPSAQVLITNASCLNNGKLLIQTFNGTGNVRYYINGNLNANGGSNPEFNNLAPGSYMLRAESSGGYIWEGQFTVGKDANPPVVTGSATAGEISLVVSGGSGSFSYKWSNGATTKDLSNVPRGKYIATITDVVTGCETVFAIELLSGSPISNQQVFVFPNPAISGTTMTLKYDFPDAVQRNVSLVDLLGRIVWKSVFSSSTGELQISLSGIPSGIYILHIDGKPRVSRQVIIR